MSKEKEILKKRGKKKMSEKQDDIELVELIASEDKEKEISIKGKPDDTWNIILLIILYLLQGIPGGLAMGSLPYLLKERLSYGEIALFSLIAYPYSLKLLWSPIVDSLYIKSIGRRKTWIIPIQFFTAFLLYWLGNYTQGLLDGANMNISSLTMLYAILIFFAATQDIAVDGWALTLLSEENLSYASTCQTIGLNTGYFMSFTIFLALNSAEFSNKFIRTVPSDVGVLSISSYLSFWAVVYVIVTFILFFKHEENEKESDEMNVTETYKKMLEVLKLPQIQKLMVILLISKIGYICNDAVTGLKMIEMGFKKEDLASIVLIDFPIQMVVGYYAAKQSNGPRPLRPWLYASFARLLLSFLSMFVVYGFPKDGVTGTYIFIVILSGVVTSFTSTVQFVGICAFFNQIADPYIGGTYMTVVIKYNLKLGWHLA
ncbi:hypothetical protein K502DRAFT_322658 [Neoconidiobolus thromboides FSU 785]|nr:hypothetical protein K502DRAFT_322658 [Neoconidiobolus thromboides FSU 785]